VDKKQVYYFEGKKCIGGFEGSQFPPIPVCIGLSIAVGEEVEIIPPEFYPTEKDFVMDE
jgi:hypothetical protein